MSKMVFVAFAIFGFILVFIWRSDLFAASFEKAEKIDKIDFSISEIANDSKVSAKVYFLGREERKKLYATDLVTVNGKVMKGEKYNNGIATGYHYILDLEIAPLYDLRVLHNGVATSQQIKPQAFSATIPSSISISKDLEIPYKAAENSMGTTFIEVSSIEKKTAILTNNNSQRALVLKAIEKADKFIISGIQLSHLKIGRAEISVSKIYNRNYAITVLKEVELIE